MTSLMEILLFVLGLFLLELRLGLFQIGIVFALFVFSRVFASLNMWVTLGTLILCYIFVVLAAYFFLIWMKRRRVVHVVLTFVCAAGAVFTREEAYVLPLALPLLWAMWARPWRAWRCTLVAVLGVLTIAGIHFALRSIFVPEVHLDPHLDFTILKLKMFLISIGSSWLPGGVSTIGLVDSLLAALWIGFLIGLAVMVARWGGTRARWRVVGTWFLGCVLSLPALGGSALLWHSDAHTGFYDSYCDGDRRGLAAACACKILPQMGAVCVRRLYNPRSRSRNRWRNSAFHVCGRIVASKLYSKNRR